MKSFVIGLIAGTCLLVLSVAGQSPASHSLIFITGDDIKVGAQRTESYFSLIRGRKIGLVTNQTSLVDGVHLADSLLSAGFSVMKVFGPEHGFRGNEEYGKEISNGKDAKTGLPVISLYGKNKKPLPVDLLDIDIMIYDIQDIGVRFFTYISTLSYVMEACAENGIPLIVLDRPDPNGFYVDGPVLDTLFRSFVGLHPVPVVYGMTAGEYAMMVNGEGWLAHGVRCQLTVIPVEGYDHKMVYTLPVRPSPNLPDWQSVYLYPSLCLFEGTIMSVGRGTDKPFRIYGHPAFVTGSYAFTPRSIPGVSEHPPFEGQQCLGADVTGLAENLLQNRQHFFLAYILNAKIIFPDSVTFFNNYFDKLSGNDMLRVQIEEQWSEDAIRAGWQEDLEKFKATRKKYLLYPDFE